MLGYMVRLALLRSILNESSKFNLVHCLKLQLSLAFSFSFGSSFSNLKAMSMKLDFKFLLNSFSNSFYLAAYCSMK